MAVDVDVARAWLLEAFPGAWEDFPFGPGDRVFKNAKGKMFALMADEGRDGFRVTMKLTPDEAEEARVLPFVDRARYLGRYGWVTVRVADDGEWELAQDWVSRSWTLAGGKTLTPGPSPATRARGTGDAG